MVLQKMAYIYIYTYMYDKYDLHAHHITSLIHQLLRITVTNLQSVAGAPLNKQKTTTTNKQNKTNKQKWRKTKN